MENTLQNLVSFFEKNLFDKIDLKEELSFRISKLKSYLKQSKIETVVIPISGGLDSAVVLGLASNITDINIIPIYLPIESSLQSMEDAKKVIEFFGHHINNISILETEGINGKMISDKDLYHSYNSILNSRAINKPKHDKHKLSIRKGNIKARLRMICAYETANRLNGIVLSTDNFSEFLMGFWTICGDVGDFAPIQTLFKGFELPKIAKILKVPDNIINKAPSDDLGVTDANTDEEQLGASYIIVDSILLLLYKEFFDKSVGVDLQLRMKRPKVFKILCEIIKENTLNSFIEKFDNKDIKIKEKIEQRFYSTEYKRRGTIQL